MCHVDALSERYIYDVAVHKFLQLFHGLVGIGEEVGAVRRVFLNIDRSIADSIVNRMRSSVEFWGELVRSQISINEMGAGEILLVLDPVLLLHRMTVDRKKTLLRGDRWRAFVS